MSRLTSASATWARTVIDLKEVPAKATLLASADDSPADRDPRLAFTLPADGRYFLVVQDAHDQGGPAYGYLLQVK